MNDGLTKYTLKTLIEPEIFINENKQVPITDIIIPRIQRDYAQGRRGKNEDRIREQFLDKLYESIQNKKPITLDFIYGDMEKGNLTLLDGQQRLTTLFLLYWYAGKKEKIDRSEYEFLKHFSYATRFSSRDFCTAIVENDIDFDTKKLSEEIKDQSWYPFDWKNDPTIQSMLVMIDAINEKFATLDNIWQALTEKDLISFYFLPLEKMGLTDELYIKMNSRGKPLTDFEHFKAEFLEIVKEQDENLYTEFSKKIDIDWTDMLFPYRDETTQIIDDKFMRYFKFVSYIIYYKNDIRPIEHDEFKLAKQLYSKRNQNSITNLKFLMSAFDCWCKIDIDEFFDSIFYTGMYQSGKVKLYVTESESRNLFLDCCKYHLEFTNNGRNRLFPLNRILLFYAVLLYRQNKKSISEENFRRRIRIIRNLTENSQYEIREFDQYGTNQMQRLFNEVKEIIFNAHINPDDRGFNLLQKKEEKTKLEWEQANSRYRDELFHLEDHYLLKGTISIVGLDNPQNFLKFRMLFHDECNKDLINQALLCFGDYSQNLQWRTQLGVKSNDSVWADLFHPTKQRNKNNRFQNTSAILNMLLSKIPTEADTVQSYLQQLVSGYLNSPDTKKDWRYYFIKYAAMRYDTYGMYWWDDANRPYEVIMMHTKERLRGKNWNVFAYTLFKLHPEQFELGGFAYQGDTLKIKDKETYIEILNNNFVITGAKQKKKEIAILQDEDGIDVQDRVTAIYAELNKYLKV